MRQRIVDESAAARAKRLLRMASQRLHTANPTEELSDILEASFPLPPGDKAYHGRLLEPSFSEVASNNLSFIMNTGGPGATPADQLETSTHAMRRLVGRHFGSEALHWLDGRIEPMRGGHRALSWGALFGSGFDRNGVMESLVSYEWGPGLMDSLPPTLHRIARIAMEALPGLRPAFSTIRCGRSSGNQWLTFEVDYALPLTNLKPLMDNLGLGHQHAGLMSACAFILGARFTLPPDTSTITLRPTRVGIEMRLDVNLDILPDAPPQLMSLMRLQMAERPTSLRALDRWLTALTPDGYDGPGSVSVLSVQVRPDMPARVALYLRPAALESPVLPVEEHKGNGAPPEVSNGTPAPAQASSMLARS